MKEFRKTSPDLFFLVVLTLLVVFGFVMLTSASSDLAKAKFGDSDYYLKHQFLYGFLFGLFGFIVTFFLPYWKLEKIAVPLLILSILFLILVFIIPSEINKVKNSERWLSLGPVVFQPGEFVKLSFIIFLAAWVGRKQARGKDFLNGFLPFLILLGTILFLLVMQPSTTIAVILALASFVTYFTAGAKLRFILGSFVLLIILVCVLVFVTPYRFNRVLTFFSPDKVNVEKEGYHIERARISIGSGGIFGVGFGKSTTKLRHLPEPIGDSIFAVIAQELGFVGAICVVLAFLFFVWRGFLIAKKARDPFGSLMAIGFTSVIGIQAFIHIGAITGFLPLTGVPLPFISYGGTALAVFLTMSGIIANISKYRR